MLSIQTTTVNRLQVRPLRAGDADGLLQLHDRTSPSSLYQRYCSAYRPDRQALAEIGAAGCGYVACHGDQIVGMGHYVGLDDESAEMALLVEDRYQNQGIGSLLCRQLIDLGRRHRLHRLVAHVDVGNRPMLRVLAKMGLPSLRQTEYGTRTVEMLLDVEQPTFLPRGWENLLPRLH